MENKINNNKDLYANERTPNQLNSAKLSFQNLSELTINRLNGLFNAYLNEVPSPELKVAMEYTLLNGGKRLRPLLVYVTGYAFNASLENLDIPAAAVEMIHTYSLIHDDLPSMDNAGLRRGKPSCHQVYGEGLAILTGDALQILALQLIASHPSPLKAEKRIKMLTILGRACGPYGMAAGQALDISSFATENIKNITIKDLLKIYRLKTGTFISACIELGYLTSPNYDESSHHSLIEFGNTLGLAFQIQDDILDIEKPTAILGKPQGIDNKNNKLTYPMLVGLPVAKLTVQQLYNTAFEKIASLGEHLNLLREVTNWMLQRKK